jgi:hypothetical protein
VAAFIAQIGNLLSREFVEEEQFRAMTLSARLKNQERIKDQWLKIRVQI